MKANRLKIMTAALSLGLALMMMGTGLRADSFGSGGNAFTIDFVTVGNAGNADDVNNPYPNPGDEGTPYGGVGYNYRMGVYEISQDQIDKATNAGMTNVTAGAWGASQPAANMQWYEAAAFVNWLNDQRTPGLKAYDLTYSGGWTMNLWSSGDAWQAGGENLYRHKDAYYFLPSEDEWYKAAYHQNDGVTANYWDYATGSNTAPTPVASGTGAGTAVYGDGVGSPAAVNNAGGLSPYGTMGQNGNVWEWNESRTDGINNSDNGDRTLRGGGYYGGDHFLRSSLQNGMVPGYEADLIGFRVASVVPEPSAALLMMSGLGAWLLKRRRRS